MRCGAALVFCALLSAESAIAQTSIERTTAPRAVDIWQPSAPFGAPGERPAAPGSEAAPPLSRPAGISAGAVRFFPSITAATFYDDNVFSANVNRRSDWAFLIRPELAFLAKGPSHAVEGQAFVEGRKYSRFSSEDQVNAGASLGGTVMVDPDTQLQGRVQYIRAHEDRGVSESAFTTFDKPVPYNQFQAAGAINKRFNRWWTSLGVAGQWVDYENPTIAGIPIDQSYRDGTISVLTTRFGYVIAPLTSLFAEWAGNHRDFKVNIFDSWGQRVVGGVLLEPGPGAAVKGEAYAGYMFQRYTGVTFQTISTWTYGGLLAWLVTPATTVTVGGHRDALESGLNGGVSLIESVAGVRVDYRVLPNLVIGAGATYVTDEFKGAGRTDRYWSPLASLKYFVNPFVTVGLDYRNVNFDSSGAAVPTYYRNVYMLSVNARI
jgi:hypothetical protein